jgi:IS30 family transposase
MASTPPIQSIPDIERLLEEKKSHLERLITLREQIQKKIDDLDIEMQSAAHLQPTKKRRGRPRLTNASPLRKVVAEILTKHKKGLTLSEITAKATEAGYRSQSKSFSNVIYQCLYHSSSVELNRHTGIYSLKK